MRSALVLTILIVAVLSSPLRAYTPKSPEVQEMVQRALEFIEQNAASSNGRYDRELGASCIAALAHLQATDVADHELVRQAVSQIEREIADGLPHDGHGNYSLAIAILLLCELDNEQHRPTIESLVAEVYSRQTSGGAWTYPNDPSGDTSQTQFAVLAMWLANQQGIDARRPAVERVCNWLPRVQAPDGVYPYKGEDSGSFTRISQERTSMSMCTAGVGSLYACGELLGLTGDRTKQNGQIHLLSAFRPVRADKAEVAAVEPASWGQAVADGNRWLAQHGDVENRDHGQRYQQYYYMYAVERYWAFRERSEGGDDAEPAWYNAGVDYLREHQADDGSWESTQNGPVIDTAFAVLFLLRSARPTMNRKEGVLDHPDFPIDEVPLSNLMDIWEDFDEAGGDPAWFYKHIELSSDSSARASQLSRLRRLLVNGPFQARLTAAKLLGRVRDLENCPYLIFALSDPDYRVAKAACDALRFISRKPHGFGFEFVNGQPPNHAAQRHWSLWLLSVKPDAELVE
jgi:hypothetical protein